MFCELQILISLMLQHYYVMCYIIWRKRVVYFYVSLISRQSIFSVYTKWRRAPDKRCEQLILVCRGVNLRQTSAFVIRERERYLVQVVSLAALQVHGTFLLCSKTDTRVGVLVTSKQ